MVVVITTMMILAVLFVPIIQLKRRGMVVAEPTIMIKTTTGMISKMKVLVGAPLPFHQPKICPL